MILMESSLPSQDDDDWMEDFLMRLQSSSLIWK